MMYLIKEATNKDQTLKMKMLLSLDNNKTAPTEKIWTKNSFLGDQRQILLFLSQISPRIPFFMPIRTRFLL